MRRGRPGRYRRRLAYAATPHDQLADAARQLAERGGRPLAEVVETYRLLGVPIPDPEAPRFVEREVRLFELLEAHGIRATALGDDFKTLPSPN